MADAVDKVRKRLDEMIARGAQNLLGKQQGDWGNEYLADQAAYEQWRISAKTVVRTLDPEGHHSKDFEAVDAKPVGTAFSYPRKLERQLAILKALREDFDGGYLPNIRGLVRAEVFSDFMDQARHLFDEGYWQPVPVIVGAVLEDHLRKLCAKHPTIVLSAKPKLDGMNADLAKAGEYGVLEQKQITVWADIRNKAAHGKWTEYKNEQVEAMIRDVPRFLIDHRLP
jgi:hypothetical protein